MPRILSLWDIDDTLCNTAGSPRGYDVLDTPREMELLEPIEAAVEVVRNRLQRADVVVRFLTARDAVHHRTSTLRWLKARVGGITTAANPVELLMVGDSTGLKWPDVRMTLADRKASAAATAARSLVTRQGCRFEVIEATDDDEEVLRRLSGRMQQFATNLSLRQAVGGMLRDWKP